MKKITISLWFVSFVIAHFSRSQTITETFGAGANQFSIDFVQIGDPGNTPDANGRGAVSYTYNIGKYEISRDVIIKASSEGGLNIDMWGFFTSSLKNPAPHVSWYEYARLVNYLNTSKGYQAAYNFDADGKIQLWNSGQYNEGNATRHKEAKYFLPTIDEWYKAGHYDPSKNNGNGGYWIYATKSDNLPDQNLYGDNFWGINEAVWGRSPYYPGPNEVDNAGSLSAYGTMAQHGNIQEWMEDIVDLSGELRFKLGAHWANTHDGFNYEALDKAWVKSTEIGARIAMVPEPSALSLLAVGLGGLAMMRRRRS